MFLIHRMSFSVFFSYEGGDAGKIGVGFWNGVVYSVRQSSSAKDSACGKRCATY